jgi:hypothetical protein
MNEKMRILVCQGPEAATWWMFALDSRTATQVFREDEKAGDA